MTNSGREAGERKRVSTLACADTLPTARRKGTIGTIGLRNAQNRSALAAGAGAAALVS